MNKEVAKKMNAFPHKELAKHAKPGDLVIDCYYMTGIKLPDNQDEFDAYCTNQRYGNTYYILVTNDDHAIKEDLLKGMALREELEVLQAKVNEIEERRKEIQTTIQNTIFKTCVDHIVLFFRKNYNEDMDPTNIEIRPGDKLLNFGRRLNNRQESLWIAIVEVPGVLNESITNHYVKSRFEYFDTKKATYSYKLKDVGYMIGDRFIESCSLVKVNHGEILETPLTR